MSSTFFRQIQCAQQEIVCFEQPTFPSVIDQPLTFTQNEILSLSSQILDMDPDPVPRYLVLRDLLHCPINDPNLQTAEQDFIRSKWITELAETQLPDGTWGNFHTRVSKLKRRFPTSEHAIHRCLALGLDGRSPMLQKTVAYITDHLSGKVQWSDHAEKHDHPGLWPEIIRTISAATLALIEPEHYLVETVWQYWADVVTVAFSGGSYDRATELARHQTLTGVPSKRFYPFHVLYPLIILSATRQKLSRDLEDRILTAVLRWPNGIYYVYNRPIDQPLDIAQHHFENWLHAHEVLARFERWKIFAPPALNWIWQQRNSLGLWDQDLSMRRSEAFPTSESWRNPQSRMIDWSVRVLRLFKVYFN